MRRGLVSSSEGIFEGLRSRNMVFSAADRNRGRGHPDGRANLSLLICAWVFCFSPARFGSGTQVLVHHQASAVHIRTTLKKGSAGALQVRQQSSVPVVDPGARISPGHSGAVIKQKANRTRTRHTLPNNALPFSVKDFCSIDDHVKETESSEHSFHFLLQHDSATTNADTVGASSSGADDSPEGLLVAEEDLSKNYLSSGVKKPAPWPANFHANAVKFPVQCEQPDWLLRKDQLVLPVNSENEKKTKTKAGISATMVLTMFLGPNAPQDWKNPSDNTPAEWLRALFAANVQVLRQFGHGLILRTKFTPDEYDGKTSLKKWEVESEQCRGKSAEDCVKEFERTNSLFEKQLMVADYLNLRSKGDSSPALAGGGTAAGREDQARYLFTHVFSLDADAALVSTAIDSIGLAAWNLAEARKDVFGANEDWQEQENKGSWDPNQFCHAVNTGFLLASNTPFTRTLFKDVFEAHKNGPNAKAWKTAGLSSVACTSNDQVCLQNTVPTLRQHFLVTSGQFWNRARFDIDKAAPAVNKVETGGDGRHGDETTTTHVVHYMNADGRMDIAAEDFCQPGFLVKPLEEETRAALGVCRSITAKKEPGGNFKEDDDRQLPQSCTSIALTRKTSSTSFVYRRQDDDEQATASAAGLLSTTGTMERGGAEKAKKNDLSLRISTGQAGEGTLSSSHESEEKSTTADLKVRIMKTNPAALLPFFTSSSVSRFLSPPPFCEGCCVGPASEAPPGATVYGHLTYHSRCLDVHKCAAANANRAGKTEDENNRPRRYTFVLTHSGDMPAPEGKSTAWVEEMFPNLRSMELARLGVMRKANKNTQIDILLYVALPRYQPEKSAEWWNRHTSYMQTELQRVAPSLVVKKVPFGVPANAKSDYNKGCEKDFIRLNSFGETSYDAIAYYDRDVELQDTSGDNLLALFQCVAEQDVFLTTTGGLNEPVNVGFFALKPRQKLLDLALEFSKLADYNEQTGWANSGWSPQDDQGHAPTQKGHQLLESTRVDLRKSSNKKASLSVTSATASSGHQIKMKNGRSSRYFVDAECGQGYFLTLFLHLQNPTVQQAYQRANVPLGDVKFLSLDRCQWNYQTGWFGICDKMQKNAACDRIIAHHKPGPDVYAAGDDVAKPNKNGECLKRGHRRLEAEVTARSEGPGRGSSKHIFFAVTTGGKKDAGSWGKGSAATSIMSSSSTWSTTSNKLLHSQFQDVKNMDALADAAAVAAPRLSSFSSARGKGGDENDFSDSLTNSRSPSSVGLLEEGREKTKKKRRLNVFYYVDDPDKPDTKKHFLRSFPLNVETWLLYLQSETVEPRVIQITDATVKNWVPDMPQEFFRLPYPAAKSDLVRYGLLYHQGGIYLDGDFVLQRPLHGNILEALAAGREEFALQEQSLFLQTKQDEDAIPPVWKNFLTKKIRKEQDKKAEGRRKKPQHLKNEELEAARRAKQKPAGPRKAYQKSKHAMELEENENAGTHKSSVEKKEHQSERAGKAKKKKAASINKKQGKKWTGSPLPFPIELFAYEYDNQYCRGRAAPESSSGKEYPPSYSSNFQGATRYSMWMKRVWDLQRKALNNPCEEPDKKGNDICCSGKDKTKECHIAWGALGEGIATGSHEHIGPKLSLTAAGEEVLKQFEIPPEVATDPLRILIAKNVVTKKGSNDPATGCQSEEDKIDGGGDAKEEEPTLLVSALGKKSTYLSSTPVTEKLTQYLTTNTGLPGEPATGGGASGEEKHHDGGTKLEGIVACFKPEQGFASLYPDVIGGNLVPGKDNQVVRMDGEKVDVPNALTRTAYHLFSSNGLPKWAEYSCEDFARDKSLLGRIYRSALGLTEDTKNNEQDKKTLERICARDILAEGVLTKSATKNPDLLFPVLDRMEIDKGKLTSGFGSTSAEKSDTTADEGRVDEEDDDMLGTETRSPCSGTTSTRSSSSSATSLAETSRWHLKLRVQSLQDAIWWRSDVLAGGKNDHSSEHRGHV
ncbi:unnamed protein product [Amoebophrya sp. A120]|nr:unnamed protein product [Amoebophrya sp. A120]|eukprot:GSA120T00015115001.1